MPSRKALKRAAIFTNPRAANDWSKDDNKFGQRMLEKMGWKKGQGIGLHNQGITENVKVRMKFDSKGLGFKVKEDQWVEVEHGFSELLTQLHKESPSKFINKTEQKSLESTSQSLRSRVHYKKWTRAKDLTKYTAKDLAGILGTATEVQERIAENVILDTASSNSIESLKDPDENVDECDSQPAKKKLKKKRKSVNEERDRLVEEPAEMKTSQDTADTAFISDELKSNLRTADFDILKKDTSTRLSEDSPKTKKSRKKKKAADSEMTVLPNVDDKMDISEMSQKRNSRLEKMSEFIESFSETSETVQDIIKSFEEKQEELLNKYRNNYKLKYLESANESDISIYSELNGDELDVKNDEKIDSQSKDENLRSHRSLSKAERIIMKAKLLKKIQKQELTVDFKGSNICNISGYGNQEVNLKRGNCSSAIKV